jgi:hypothetical protein
MNIKTFLWEKSGYWLFGEFYTSECYHQEIKKMVKVKQLIIEQHRNKKIMPIQRICRIFLVS